MQSVRIFLVFVSVIAFGVVGHASSAHAFSVTDQSVVRLSDDTVLFSLTYRLNFLNREAQTPLLALPSSAPAVVPAVRYSFVDADDRVVSGVQSHSLVLSDTAVRGRAYHLPEATPGLFRLVSIVRLQPDFTADSLTLRIDQVPLTLLDAGVATSGRVPDTYLPDFRTDPFTR